MGSGVNSDLKTTPLTNDPPDSINDTVSNIAAYLGNLNYPKASLSPTNFTFTSIAVGLTATRTFTVSNLNSRGPLTVSSVAISDTTNYSVNNGCSSVAVGNSCDIVVTFQPQSFGAALNATLTVNHDALGGTSTASISGTGLAPFVVSPTLLSFTAATAPTGVLHTTITDNKGDQIQICRVDAATFDFPNDFSLDAPFTLGSDGCFTTATTGTVPRTLSLDVRFAAGDLGPRNGALRIRRVDGSGNPLTGTATIVVQLQGNPGPFATVNASSLFDAVGDPGVEVDNDNTLDRSFTLFSRGSDPLVFNGSTFVISGTSSSEYSLVPSGCLTLGSLAASTGGTPPSCVVTVRFNPSDVGRRAATLTIHFTGTTDNAITLDGFGFRGPRLAVQRGTLPLSSPATLQFGTQTIGGLYPAISVTLTNGGTLGDLEVSLPAAGSVDGFGFVPTAGCANLAPAAECTVAIRFNPAAIQAYASPLVVQTRAAGTAAAFDSFQLNLLGQGTASAVPVLSWTDTTGTPITRLGFPDTDIGSPNTTHIRLYNDGPGGVNLQLANAIGVDAPQFVLDTSDCASGKDVFEKTSCDIAVQFAPGSPGAKTASIQLAANAGVAPPMLIVAPLLPTAGTAIGTAAPATLQLSSTSLQFTGTVVGTAAAPMELRLQNTGIRDLNVQSLSVLAPFTISPKSCASVPFVLPPGNECSVSVSFTPQGEGDVSGTLTITTDGSASAQSVALSGRGEPKADLSSGGCSIASGDSATDPTLWTLVLLAAAVLFYRRRARHPGDANRRRRT